MTCTVFENRSMAAVSVLFCTFLATAAAISLGGCGESRPEPTSPESPSAGRATDTSAPAKSRTVRFDYAFTVEGLPPGKTVRVWCPVPPTNGDQSVEEIDRDLPAEAGVATEKKHGNRILYLEPKAPANGRLEFRISWRVVRREVKGLASPSQPEALSPERRRLYLAANANVPLQGRPLRLLEGIALHKDPLKQARQLYDRVDAYVTYDKSQPGYGRGDVAWVCDSRRGNCSDFHSLFISLARSQGLPARFEIGFPLPEQRGGGAVAGYHCWAYFYANSRGWVPVDISEADKHPALKDYYFGNLTENRIAFSTGRDLLLVPWQASGPLNFFIDPCVEVGGRRWPAEKVKTRYAFRDL